MSDHKLSFIGRIANPYALLAHVAEQPGIVKVVVHIVCDDGFDAIAAAGVECRDVAWSAARLTEYALKGADNK